MVRLISDQKGNIIVAMALAVFALASAITLATLAMMGTISTRNDCNRVQQFFLLRSESKRAQVILESRDNLQSGIYLPEKFVTVKGSHSINTFRLQTRILKSPQTAASSLSQFNEYRILSLVTEKPGNHQSFAVGGYNSPVRTCSEKRIRRSTLSGYHYMSDLESSTNNTNVYFWGPDVVYGKVHSNSDIWLKQGGGGSNNGWPTFYGPVYTAGQIQVHSGMPPFNLVFRNGYWEHVTPIEFNLTADAIRANGVTIGPSDYNPNRIVYVKVNGPVYTALIGNIVDMGYDSTDVWTEYPPPNGMYQYHNKFHRYDTLWTIGSQGSILNRSAIVFSKLWLQGRFQGAQTWCAADTLYLTDDCYLAHTPMGSFPDGTVLGSGYNHTDLLGIVSEKTILVKYGHKDPETDERLQPNCGGESNGIWIYAALCAMGDGNGDAHKDGVFSFEYQHPHPSVPDLRLPGNNQVWNRIDLHRHRYPQRPDSPWPATLDYPWYNPLWPEARPIKERGGIHLRGAVAQRRRGYVHRGLTDGEYPNPGGIWNIPLDYCGGSSGESYQDPILNLNLSCVNAAGTTLNGVGYIKDYRYDFRFDLYSPPDFPELYLRGRRAVYDPGAWYFKRPPRSLSLLD